MRPTSLFADAWQRVAPELPPSWRRCRCCRGRHCHHNRAGLPVPAAAACTALLEQGFGEVTVAAIAALRVQRWDRAVWSSGELLMELLKRSQCARMPHFAQSRRLPAAPLPPGCPAQVKFCSARLTGGALDHSHRSLRPSACSGNRVVDCPQLDMEFFDSWRPVRGQCTVERRVEGTGCEAGCCRQSVHSPRYSTATSRRRRLCQPCASFPAVIGRASVPTTLGLWTCSYQAPSRPQRR